MKKIISLLISIILVNSLFSQWGTLAVFEEDEAKTVRFVRMFPVKCTVTDIQPGYSGNIMQNVNNFMHLDGKRVYAKFFIPFSGFDAAKKFALDEYIPKKDAKSVRFIEESEEILLNEKGEVVSSKKKEKPLGTIIAYYNNGTEIYEWSACEVWGKSLTKTPGELARQCGGKGANGGVMISDWKPGMDWYAAEKEARKRASRYAIPGTYKAFAIDDYGRNQLSLYQTGYTAEEAENIRKGKQPDGEKIDYTKEDYVDNLPPATINKFKSSIKEEENRLRSQGWERFGSRYDYAEHLVNQLIYGPRQEQPVSVIVVTEDANVKASIIQNYMDVAVQSTGSKNYAVFYDLQSPTDSRKLNLFVENQAKTKLPVGLIFYKRKPTFEGDLLSLFYDARKGFSFFKGVLLKNESGNEVYAGTKSLGHLSAELFRDATLNKWVYNVYTANGDQDSDLAGKRLNSLLNDMEKRGQYIVRRRESDDKKTSYTEVFDKSGNLVLYTEKQSAGTKADKWTFYENNN